jgi:hypothetical protein
VLAFRHVQLAVLYAKCHEQPAVMFFMQRHMPSSVHCRVVCCSSSAFQPYRPTAVRAGPGGDAAAAAAGYASKPLTIANPQAAFGANSSPPKDGSADWKARLLQRFHSAHTDAAEEP